MTAHDRDRPAAALSLPARRGAWDAYLTLTAELLPAVQAKPMDDIEVISALAGLAIRIRWYAPMWAHRGPILVAAVESAIQFRAIGDRDGLLMLLQPITRGLFSLSRAPSHRRPS